MNNNSGSNIVSVLKQKMNDTKDEITKYKEKVQDLENKIQVKWMDSWLEFIVNYSENYFIMV